MSVRNAAAGNINRIAADILVDAAGFDLIGERGIGDRMKRTAAELKLAAELLRTFDGPPAYDMPEDTKIKPATVFPEGLTVTPQDDEDIDLFGDDNEDEDENRPAPKFEVGQRVRVIATHLIPYEEGYEFEVTGVVDSDNRYGHGHFYVTGDRHGYGVWEKYLELVSEREPMADWEKELLLKVGDRIRVRNNTSYAIKWDGQFGKVEKIGSHYNYVRLDSGAEILLTVEELEIV